MQLDPDSCDRAVRSHDARFDGWFFAAVTSTRIYCRPSCPAVTPRREHVRFFATAAAAQQAGFRACLRCRPDAAPGSPQWLGRGDVAARALRLILDGVVDREGVAGLARRVGHSERRLHRALVAEAGAGALALARAQRAQTALILLTSTDLPIAQVAFGAGFASRRQLNDTVRAVFARTPIELRAGSGPPRRGAATGGAQSIRVRLPHRRPLAAAPLFGFLGRRAVAGVESYDGATYRRSLRLPHGEGTVALAAEPDGGAVGATFVLEDLRDLTAAIARCRRLLGLDADPVAIDAALAEDPLLAPLVAAVPGLRVPGAVDGFEIAVRAVIGQQVSVSGARTVAGGLVRAAGTPLREPVVPLTHLFPTAAAVARCAAAAPEAFAMPAARRRTLAALADAVEAGTIEIDAAADPHALEAGLRRVAGIGPWTAAYVAMRALGDPDAFLPTDLGVRRAVAALGGPDDPRSIERLAERWRPWRAHAVAHLWRRDAEPAAPDTATAPRVA